MLRTQRLIITRQKVVKARDCVGSDDETLDMVTAGVDKQKRMREKWVVGRIRTFGAKIMTGTNWG